MDTKRLLSWPCLAMVWSSLLTSVWGQPATRLSPLAARTDMGAPKTPDWRPQYTNRESFFIPVQRAASNSKTMVRLFVSLDQGRRWELFQGEPTQGDKFHFVASEPGEYWFAAGELIQGKQQLYRGGKPELVVVFEKTKPDLKVRLVDVGNGEIEATWIAQDEHLVPESFQLQVADPVSQEWRDLSFDLPVDTESNSRWQGKTRWRLDPRVKEVQVRAQIADRAKNVTMITEQLPLSAPSNRSRSFEQPAELPDDAPLDQEWIDPTSPWNDDRATTREARHDRERPTLADDGWPSRVQPPVSRRIEGDPIRNPSTEGASESSTTDPAATNVTASPNFELDYDLYNVGERGAKLVELWVTNDKGRTWKLLTTDDDVKSPVEVRLRDEGLYGFLLAVHGYDAPRPPAPQDGDGADIWVVVDWSKPIASITRAEFDPADGSASLTINWKASDSTLGEFPISLNYSANPRGPWETIATNLRNSGVYRWELDQHIPRQIYLQLEVKDEAGNITTDVYQQLISTEGHSPEGRIRHVRPLNRRP